MIRSLLRGLSTVFITAGLLLLVDAGVTLLWQEPVSAFLAQQDQDRLAGDLKNLEVAAPSVIEKNALQALPDLDLRLAFLARSLRRKTPDGGALGRIRIRKIGANYVIVKGTDADDLTKGPGLYRQTPLPGVPGTVAIAGHRTTYGAPFRHIDELDKNDTIEVDMPYGRFTYAVEKRLIVDPNALWVIHKVSHDRLVLTACHPLYSAAQRIVVFARLAHVEPRGTAAEGTETQTLVDKPPGLS
jgi:sortase A